MHRTKTVRAAVAAAAVAIAALAAGPLAGAGAATRAATPAQARPEAPSRSGRTDGFPVSLPSQGGTVVVPSRPDRILSLSPSATQMLYAIGAGKQVVGVDKYSTYPPDAPRTKFTGGETNAEGYLPLHPDLVLMAFPSGTVVKQLTLLHIPVLVLPPASGLAQADQQVHELGRATGHVAQAGQVVASFMADVHKEAASAGGAGRGKTYYIELSPDYYTATSRTFIGAELSLFGMKDIADPAGRGTGYPQISAEYVLHANPYYVFLADTVCCSATPASFGHRPGFSALSAVRDHRVVGVNDSVASQWGPHTVESFVGLIARLLRR